MSDIQEKESWEEGLELSLKKLGFAIFAYENAKQVDRENSSRPLSEITDISRLHFSDAERHGKNVTQAYDGLKSFIRTLLQKEREMIELEYASRRKN